MHMRNNRKSTEALTLTTLRALAPLALDVFPSASRSANAPPAASRALSANHGEPAASCNGHACLNFDDIAGEAMSLAGLLKPGSCRQVFSSDAGSQSAASRRRSNLANAQAIRLHSGMRDSPAARDTPTTNSGTDASVPNPIAATAPIATLASESDSAVELWAGNSDVGSRQVVKAMDARFGPADATLEERREWAASESGTLFSDDSDSGQDMREDGWNKSAKTGSQGYVVSVMLPVKNADAHDAFTLTALSHLYVVLFKPDHLITYACDLTTPVYI